MLTDIQQFRDHAGFRRAVRTVVYAAETGDMMLCLVRVVSHPRYPFAIDGLFSDFCDTRK